MPAWVVCCCRSSASCGSSTSSCCHVAKAALEAAAYLQSSLITDQQQAAPSLISNRFSMLGVGSYRAAVIDILSLLSAVVHYMSLGMNYILDCVYNTQHNIVWTGIGMSLDSVSIKFPVKMKVLHWRSASVLLRNLYGHSILYVVSTLDGWHWPFFVSVSPFWCFV